LNYIQNRQLKNFVFLGLATFCLLSCVWWKLFLLSFSFLFFFNKQNCTPTAVYQCGAPPFQLVSKHRAIWCGETAMMREARAVIRSCAVCFSRQPQSLPEFFCQIRRMSGSDRWDGFNQRQQHPRASTHRHCMNYVSYSKVKKSNAK
jgi:hypothetical protein